MEEEKRDGRGRNGRVGRLRERGRGMGEEERRGKKWKGGKVEGEG